MADISEMKAVDNEAERLRRQFDDFSEHPDGGHEHFLQSDLGSEDFGVEADYDDFSEHPDGGHEHFLQSDLGSEDFGVEADIEAGIGDGWDYLRRMGNLNAAWDAMASTVTGVDGQERGLFEALKSLEADAEDIYVFTEGRSALKDGTVTGQMSALSDRWGMFLVDVSGMDAEAQRRASGMAPRFEAADKAISSALACNPENGGLTAVANGFATALGKAGFSLRPRAGNEWHPVFKLAMAHPEARNVLRGMFSARVRGYGKQVESLQVEHVDLLAVKSDKQAAWDAAKGRVEALKSERSEIERELAAAWKRVGEESRRKSLVARVFSPLLSPDGQSKVADAMERVFGTFGTMTASMIARVATLGGWRQAGFGKTIDRDSDIPTPYAAALAAKDAVKERLEAKKDEIVEAKGEVREANKAVVEAAKDAKAKLREIGSREKAAKSLGWLVSKIGERDLKDEAAKQKREAQPSLDLCGRSPSRTQPASPAKKADRGR